MEVYYDAWVNEDKAKYNLSTSRGKRRIECQILADYYSFYTYMTWLRRLPANMMLD